MTAHPIATAADAETVVVSLAGQVTGRPGGPQLVTYRGSVTDAHGAAWFLGDCTCSFCERAAAHNVNDDRAVLVTVGGLPITHVRLASIVFPARCTRCGDAGWALQDVLRAKDLGTFSLAGVQLKVSASAAVVVVCAGCCQPA